MTSASWRNTGATNGRAAEFIEILLPFACDILRAEGIEGLCRLDVSSNITQTGRYSQFQPIYASLGITTFPCSTSEKKPLVSNYLKMGISASRQMAARFTSANALGIACGEHNNITILDVDSTDRGILKEAIHRHGKARVVVQTASGKFHAYYSHSGEQRCIRPWKDLPIDVLGGGFVVAPPSLFGAGEYYFIEGRFDDLRRLTPITGIEDIQPREHIEKRAKQGNRNTWLYRQCMRAAYHCDSLEQLMDVARTRNEECEPPMEDIEAVTIAANAWTYTLKNKNRFDGHQHGAWIPFEVLASMQGDADAMYLLTFLKVHQGPLATFMITNSLHERFGWTLVRLVRARNALIEGGYIYQARPAIALGGKGGKAALFRWKD
jgi:hypothetical protein